MVFEISYTNLNELIEGYLQACDVRIIALGELDMVIALAEEYIQRKYKPDLYMPFKPLAEGGEFCDWESMRDELQEFGQFAWAEISKFQEGGLDSKEVKRRDEYMENFKPRFLKWISFWMFLASGKMQYFQDNWLYYRLHTVWDYIYKLYLMIDKEQRGKYLDVLIDYHRKNLQSEDLYYKVIQLRKEC